MIKFGNYEGNSANLKDEGTLRSIIGKGGKIAFIPKNYNNPEKRVAVVLKQANGQSATVACSEQLSKLIRAKKVTLGQLLGLKVLTNEDDASYVSMPATTLHEIAVDSVKEEAFEAAAEEFLPEELIA